MLLQPAPGFARQKPNMEIKGTKPDNVECFKYLGSTMTSTYIMDKEVLNRLAIAGASIGRLWTQVWEKRVITVRTELQVYKVIVISSLLYGCETWTLDKSHYNTGSVSPPLHSQGHAHFCAEPTC